MSDGNGRPNPERARDELEGCVVAFFRCASAFFSRAHGGQHDAGPRRAHHAGHAQGLAQAQAWAGAEGQHRWITEGRGVRKRAIEVCESRNMSTPRLDKRKN